MSVSAPANPKIRSLISEVVETRPLRAGAFIVTLYGDVMIPRGGSLWIGNVIEACDAVGISETLVRTAVSRLVAAGRLTGQRDGRRSFYRLTAEATEEFERAADILYGAPRPVDAAEWTLVLARDSAARAALDRLAKLGFGIAGNGLALLPGDAAREAVRTLAAEQNALVFTARLADGQADATLRDLVAAAWDLEALAAAYREFAAVFVTLDPVLANPTTIDGGLALTARLLLVDAYRRVALRDPGLPPEVLPDHWPGEPAAALFARIYTALSPPADAYIAETFVDGNGPLAADATVLAERLRGLAGFQP